MRELKFRAYHKMLKRYLEPNEWFLTADGTAHSGYVDETFCNEFLESFCDDKNVIVEQYTGLKDENGIEIYEGDIIREKWFDEDARRGENRVGKCEYFMGSFVCWFVGGRIILLGMFPVSHIEVIGNIHENPELLEKAQQCQNDQLT